MGYKLAGYNHLGGVEIDPQVADVYKTNHNPKYLFVEDIRDFAERETFPEELYNLDILDGSPPCSSFSMAGNREKDWGKEKVFREGQAMQRLDDLFFDYIKLAKKLQPKVVIAENVKGMLQGNAKAYIKRIKAEFEKAGYAVQLFLLNAASMGVPQKRERVFFMCQRKDLNLPNLKLAFSEPPILFSSIEKFERLPINGGKNCKLKELWALRKNKEDFVDIQMRVFGKNANFTTHLVYDDEVFPTIVSSTHYYHYLDCAIIADNEYAQIGTYPLDYNFKNITPKYLIGMSVPPVMTAQVAHQIYLQWFAPAQK